MAAQMISFVRSICSNSKLTACGSFNDMDNLVDPSISDITSGVLEMCTVIIRNANAADGRPPVHLVQRAKKAVPGAIRFIAAK